MLQKILFFIVILISNIVQCITGFAGTVLAMPFSILLVGYDVAKPILNIVAIAVSAVIVIKDRKYINLKEALRIIVVMLIGMIVGMIIINNFAFEGTVLYKILGMIVIIFALYNGYRFFAKKEDKQLPAILSAILLIVSGVVHGMFVCGGPLLVTYVNGRIKDKNEFRATISLVWVVLNFIIMLDDISVGYFNLQLIYMLIIALLVLAVAYIIGNLIYKKMSKNVFLVLTYVLMLISGISLLVK